MQVQLIKLLKNFKLRAFTFNQQKQRAVPIKYYIEDVSQKLKNQFFRSYIPVFCYYEGSTSN